jgi:hypothetical protein
MVSHYNDMRKIHGDIPFFSMTTKIPDLGELGDLSDNNIFIFGKLEGEEDTGFASFDAWRPKMKMFVQKAIMFLRQQRHIFIACQQGKDRSVLFATIVIGVLFGKTREDAFNYIKYYRPFITTDSFVGQWGYIEEMIRDFDGIVEETQGAAPTEGGGGAKDDDRPLYLN